MRRTMTLAATAALAALIGLEALAPGRSAQEMPRPAVAATADGLAVATFAAGCFWCMEGPFDKLDGVKETVSGYAGGHVANPTYAQVSSGGTGHTEVVQVRYDPAKVAYATLLEVYWRNVDPFDADGQFCDRGSQYRPAIFAHGEEQARQARESKAKVEKELGKPVIVPVESAPTFYPAEAYHQNYYLTNPLKYTYYRYACGRDARLERVWGAKPTG